MCENEKQKLTNGENAPLFQIPANKLIRAAKCKQRGEHPINLPKYFDKSY